MLTTVGAMRNLAVHTLYIVSQESRRFLYNPYLTITGKH